MDVMHKRRANRRNTKAQRDNRNEPSRADPFAADVGGNLEDDVADVEDRQDRVVVVASQFEVLLQASQSCVACGLLACVSVSVVDGLANQYWRGR